MTYAKQLKAYEDGQSPRGPGGGRVGGCVTHQSGVTEEGRGA